MKLSRRRWLAGSGTAAFLLSGLALQDAPARAQTPGTAVPAAPAPAAKSVLDAAIKTARAANKTILVHFGATW